MKLTIIGNGFDLHHGLNTSFAEFRNHLIETNESEIVEDIDAIIKRHNANTEIPNMCWNDIESYFYKEFNAMSRNALLSSENRKKSLDRLESTVANFTAELYDYLLGISENFTCNTNKDIHDEISTSNVILTFNYTSLYSKYLINDSIDIFHIHGNLTKGNLPLIGYYFPETIRVYGATEDYRVMYNNKFLHKPSLAMKQTNIDFENNLKIFTDKYNSKIDEIVVIGFSFGESDNHIFNALDNLLVKHKTAENMRSESVEKINKIRIKIFSYDEVETKAIIKKIRNILQKECKRRFSVSKTGVGFFTQEVEIITFKELSY